MLLLLMADIIGALAPELIMSVLTGLVSVIAGYIVIRERLLKSELRLQAMSDYIDRKNEILEAKIKDIQEDIHDFKELNRETSRSLIENTTAIRELKLVLTMLKEQLGVKGMRKIKNSTDDDL